MCKSSFHIFCLSKCHCSNSKPSGYIMIFILIWWLIEVDIVKVICLSEYWCCTDFHATMCRSAEEGRFADETVNNDADVLFCPVEKTSAVFGRKRVWYHVLLTSLSFSIGRLWWSRRTRPTGRRRPSSTAKTLTNKQTNSHMQNSKTSLLKVSE